MCRFVMLPSPCQTNLGAFLSCVLPGPSGPSCENQSKPWQKLYFLAKQLIVGKHPAHSVSRQQRDPGSLFTRRRSGCIGNAPDNKSDEPAPDGPALPTGRPFPLAERCTRIPSALIHHFTMFVSIFQCALGPVPGEGGLATKITKPSMCGTVVCPGWIGEVHLQML